MRATLVAGLVTDASALPPVADPLDEVRHRHDRLRAGPGGAALGRLLLLASQLGDEAVADLPDDHLGVLADQRPRRAVGDVQRRVPAAGTAAAIAELRDLAPALYLEATDPTERSHLEPVATARAVGIDARAALRLEPGAAGDTVLAAFIEACVGRGLPFRLLTDWLPVQRQRPDGPTGVANLVAATRCALDGRTDAIAAALRATTDGVVDAATGTFRGIGREIDDVEVRATLRSLAVTDVARQLEALEDVGRP